MLVGYFVKDKVFGIAQDLNNMFIMIGFKITWNDKLYTVTTDSLLCVFLCVGDHVGDNNFSITGLDSKCNRYVWCDQELKIGDKIKIRTEEIDKMSEFQEKQLMDWDELKEQYFNLKRELEEEGLI